MNETARLTAAIATATTARTERAPRASEEHAPPHAKAGVGQEERDDDRRRDE